MAKDERSTFDPIKLTFGELEARLSRLHEISSEKRTQFQARLRNFQRLGIPAGVAAGRGKTVHYGAGQVFEMALAVELTQLGLLPERIQSVFAFNSWPIGEAVSQAAKSILDKGGFPSDRTRVDENMTITSGQHWETHPEEEDPVSYFLFFDPTALSALTEIPDKYEDQASATFFYGGPQIVRQNLVRWTAGPHTRRLSLINVTAVIWGLVVRTKPERQVQFCQELKRWADILTIRDSQRSLNDAIDRIENAIIIDNFEDVVAHAEAIKNIKGLPRHVAEAMVERARVIVSSGKLPPPGAGLTGKPLEQMSNEEFIEEMASRLISAGLSEMVARSAIDASIKIKESKERERKAKSGGASDGNS